ncbi:MAG: hypothetical protein WB622_11735 [Acidobacteriaceae bacterium]
MKIPSLFIARVALCAAIAALCLQPQTARTSRASFVPWTASPGVILCGPGLVYRCTTHGCYCVKP